jgi:hypothetical protein
MKKIRLTVSVFASLVFLASCATVQQNIDARAYLAKCHYDFAGLSVTGVKFSSGILIDSVDLKVDVKVTNTTDKDVALDHAELAFSLDKNPILETAHKNFVRIAPAGSATEAVAVTLPFGGIVKTLGHRPEKVGVKAKLWVTLLVGKDTWETPLVIPVEVEVPIPYDQIDAFVAQKQKQLQDEAAAQAKKAADEAAAKAAQEAAAKAAEAAKNALPAAPSVPSVHF